MSAMEAVARAIFCADCDFGYSIRLTSLVDNVSEYTLTYSDGSEPLKFDSYHEASEHTEGRRNEVRARAAIQALREMTLVYRDDGQVVHEMRGAPDDIWKTLLDAALGSHDAPASEASA